MRTLIYLLLFTCITITSVSAQRTADLRVTLMTPADNTTIVSGSSSFNIRFSVKNVGISTIGQGDSLGVYLLHDADTIPVLLPGGPSNYDPTPITIMKPGDSVIISKTDGFPFAIDNDTVELCVLVKPISGDMMTTLSELTMGDNISCATMYVTGHPTNVPVTPETLTGVQVSPNPASGQAYFYFELQKQAEVALTITDITGKTVVAVPVKKYSAGSQQVPVSVHSLASGIYNYRIQCGSESRNGKLVIR